MNYTCSDEGGSAVIEADSAQEAAQEYVDGGDWGEITTTQWVSVWVKEGDEDYGTIKIAIDPTEPDCIDGNEHVWRSPYSVVGGIKENPGVWGHGGGVRTKCICLHCGTYLHGDTWGQDQSDGEQGLATISYSEADSDSIAWLDRRALRTAS